MLLAARDAGVRRVDLRGLLVGVRQTRRSFPSARACGRGPLSPYAVGKLAGEEYLRIFAELYGLETLTLRYFNVFGPRQDPCSPYSGVISLFTTALLAGRTPVIYGDGRQSRDFTYVANVVHGNLLALRARGLAGQAVNLATGRRITLLELLGALARLPGGQARAEHRPARAGTCGTAWPTSAWPAACSAIGRRCPSRRASAAPSPGIGSRRERSGGLRRPRSRRAPGDGAMRGLLAPPGRPRARPRSSSPGTRDS